MFFSLIVGVEVTSQQKNNTVLTRSKQAKAAVAI
jgi:hypothetical protein